MHLDGPGAASRLARARERALSGSEVTGVRAPIEASWARAARAGLDPDRSLPPVPLLESDVSALRADHPLAAVWPLLASTLRDAMSAPRHLVFLSDATGHLLWVEGERPAVRVAENANLVPGALWSEREAGTSGVGTALELRRPFRVLGAEHYLSTATSYVCAAAPIRDAHGRVLGAVDVTAPLRDGRHDPLPVVVLAARLAEAALREQAYRRHLTLRSRYAERLARRTGARSAIVTGAGRVLQSHPGPWLPSALGTGLREGPVTLPDGQAVIVERLAPGGPYFVMGRDPAPIAELAYGGLGRERASLRVDGVAHELSRRHGELVAILLATPGGLSGAALARAMYGEQGKAATVRAELTRLRRVLGPRLAADPYRLIGDARADFLDLDRDLGTASVGELIDRYRGPLLPGSRAPGVVRLREALHRRMRSRVFEAGCPDDRRRWLDAEGARADLGS